MAMSVAGIVFDGYFFAFHLLNIVNNNQLLRGVIQAVTQNGDTQVYSHNRHHCRAGSTPKYSGGGWLLPFPHL